MTGPAKVLIVGGGFSGMAAALALRANAIAVDLVEIDPSWRNYGAGITIGGAALRALRQLGLLPAVMTAGYCADHVEVFDITGTKLAAVPTPRVAGPDVPGSGAIMRPVLAKVLADATRGAGANVRLGTSFETITQDATGVDVHFTDNTRGRYDLVIAADGLNSSLRQRLIPEAPRPEYVGQGVWRAVLPRPVEVTCTQMYLGAKTKVGLNPVSQDEMYLFVTEQRSENTRVQDGASLTALRDLLAEFTAPMAVHVREQLHSDSHIIYRPLHALLLPRPWHRGRIAFIGDTVHATTPHLAAGAGLGLEDALVLAEELAVGPDISASLERFELRRFERCRMVVENSRRLCDLEISGGSKREHAELMGTSHQALAAPI